MNPDLHALMKAAIAATVGVVSYALVADGAFAVTQRTDPTMQTLVRNRYIATAIFTVGGLALALKWPFVGAGVAAGALATSLGPPLSALIGSVLDKKQESKPTAAGMGAVYGQDMAAVYGQDMGAVYGQDMAAVYGQDMGAYEQMSGYQQMSGYLPMQGMGDVTSVPPWGATTPFGF